MARKEYRWMWKSKTTWKGLLENMSGQWRYRIGNYRVICEIQDEEIIVLVLEIGHRKDVYDKQKGCKGKRQD